jgi:hypothetical protein
MSHSHVKVWVVVALAISGVTVSAHHSATVYEDKTILLKNATVSGLAWTNPHTILTFDVRDADGQVTTWSAESGSPSALRRMGWNRNSLRPGDAVAVELFPARNGARVGRLARVILPDGKELLDSFGTEGRVRPPQ